MSSFFEREQTSVHEAGGVKTVKTLAFDNFTGVLVSEKVQTFQFMPAYNLGQTMTNESVTVYTYAAMCPEKVDKISTTEKAMVPVRTKGSDNLAEAKSAQLEFITISQTTVENFWAGEVGTFMLQKRITTKVLNDKPIIRQLEKLQSYIDNVDVVVTVYGNDFVLGYAVEKARKVLSDVYLWTYPRYDPEITIERWEVLGNNRYYYARERAVVKGVVGALVDSVSVVNRSYFERSALETFSELSDKPPPTVSCVIAGPGDDEDDKDEPGDDDDTSGGNSSTGTVVIPVEDPAAPAFPGGASGPTFPDGQPVLGVASLTEYEAWDDALNNESARGLPVLP